MRHTHAFQLSLCCVRRKPPFTFLSREGRGKPSMDGVGLPQVTRLNIMTIDIECAVSHELSFRFLAHTCIFEHTSGLPEANAFRATGQQFPLTIDNIHTSERRNQFNSTTKVKYTELPRCSKAEPIAPTRHARARTQQRNEPNDPH